MSRSRSRNAYCNALPHLWPCALQLAPNGDTCLIYTPFEQLAYKRPPDVCARINVYLSLNSSLRRWVMLRSTVQYCNRKLNTIPGSSSAEPSCFECQAFVYSLETATASHLHICCHDAATPLCPPVPASSNGHCAPLCAISFSRRSTSGHF